MQTAYTEITSNEMATGNRSKHMKSINPAMSNIPTICYIKLDTWKCSLKARKFKEKLTVPLLKCWNSYNGGQLANQFKQVKPEQIPFFACALYSQN